MLTLGRRFSQSNASPTTNETGKLKRVIFFRAAARLKVGLSLHPAAGFINCVCLFGALFLFLPVFFRPISEGWALDSAVKSDLMAVLSSTNRQIHLIEMLTDGGHFLFVFYRQETSKQTNSMSSTAIRPLRSGAPKVALSADYKSRHVLFTEISMRHQDSDSSEYSAIPHKSASPRNGPKFLELDSLTRGIFLQRQSRSAPL